MQARERGCETVRANKRQAATMQVEVLYTGRLECTGSRANAVCWH